MSGFSYSLKKVIINIIVILALSFLLGFLFLQLYLPMYTNHGETVSVPDLSGYTFDESIDILDNSGLKYEVSLDSGFSTDEKALAVLKQIPAAEEQVKSGRKIYLTLNARNAPLIKMPNLVNMLLKNVQETLANMGLERGEIIYVPDIGINVVLEQRYRGVSINEGFEVPKGAKIDLVVGDGLGNQILSVPNFVGMDETDAEFLILGSGLRLGQKNYSKNDTIPTGYVFKQTPEANMQVKTGEIIDLWISGERDF
ncbi:PASTA domain-containing protein [Algoriphagus zhangzhouensis]|uniref:PASTA domain, binds beta-lactams n=1 Tax=Algoriphagus zhangzhouensis TaxID=1073327 RepID=A0A1M7Z3G1_9BACT|nr:PASTA domain-containing protein [Algoriphagus zhangzhouensis]TDY48337.1 beta-lactam-binding protein with PASTA domain [Algoriphagus zhangzhouensis]SHO59384.1 PASTA domain, binds beta-lactams [Algoriphagus zhangzhouensis]